MAAFLMKRLIGNTQSEKDEKISPLERQDDKITSLTEELVSLRRKLQDIENTQNEKQQGFFPLGRPDGETPDVFVRIGIVSVNEIDTVKQEMQCEFYLSLRFQESMLVVDQESNELKRPAGCIKWHPNVYFQNLLSYDMYETHEVLAMGNDGPEVKLYYHITGRFKQIFNVSSFPFDLQKLEIKMSTRDVNIKFQSDWLREDSIRTDNFPGKNEWVLQNIILTKSTKTKEEDSPNENTFSIHNMYFYARRHSTHYLYNIALIMLLITTLTFASFTLDPNSPADRLSITLTLLLTSVGMKYVANGYVPQMDYLTLLDKYIIISMAFQFFVGVQNTVSALVYKHFNKFISYYELGSLVVFLSAYSIIQVAFVCSGLKFWLANKTTRGQAKKVHFPSLPPEPKSHKVTIPAHTEVLVNNRNTWEMNENIQPYDTNFVPQPRQTVQNIV
eukprot:gene3123-3591_t